MIKKIYGLLIVTICLFIGKEAHAQKSLLWEIKHPTNGHKSYLFGTYHLVGSDYLLEHKRVEEAYLNANTVVVEMVMDSSKLMQFGMASMMQTPLKTLVDSAEYQLIKEKIEPIAGVSIDLLGNFKPVMLSVMYSVHLASESTPENEQYEGSPIDIYFAQNAKQRDKTVIGLEEMMEQAKMIYDADPVEKQAENLVKLLSEDQEASDATDDLISAYANEDLGAMLALSDEWSEEFGDMTALIDDRNKNWIPTLEPLLTKGNAFIAVGALHLPGENGLLSLLKKAGYKVSAVK
jgi:uncharacterized protein YbaP (TraB family)